MSAPETFEAKVAEKANDYASRLKGNGVGVGESAVARHDFTEGALAAREILGAQEAGCPNESWECARIQRRLETELDAEKARSADLEKRMERAKARVKELEDASFLNEALEAEKERSAKYREAIKRIASCESRYPGDCPGIAQMALAETENACS